jgi:hypothetical protein
VGIMRGHLGVLCSVYLIKQVLFVIPKPLSFKLFLYTVFSKKKKKTELDRVAQSV